MTTAHGQTVVLITGGTGILGYETAKELLLSSADYHVIIGARSPLKGEQALAALKRTPGCKGSASGVIIDVDNVESIARSAEDIGMVYGRIDILINTAGARSGGRDVVTNLQRILSANVVGAVAVAEYYKHLLRRSAFPRIVFVSPARQGPAVDAAAAGSKSHTSLSEDAISRAALSIAVAQIANGYTSERGLEGLKVFGAEPAPALGEASMEASGSNVKDPQLAAMATGARLITSVAKGDHDDRAGRMIGAFQGL